MKYFLSSLFVTLLVTSSYCQSITFDTPLAWSDGYINSLEYENLTISGVSESVIPDTWIDLKIVELDIIISPFTTDLGGTWSAVIDLSTYALSEGPLTFEVSIGLPVKPSFMATYDITLPTIVQTMTLDTDSDGLIDAMEIEFSESIIDASIIPEKFSIRTDGVLSDPFDGFVTSVVEISNNNFDDDRFITLNLSNPINVQGTGVAEFNHEAGAFEDYAGNPSSSVSYSNASDGAAPMILSIEMYDNTIIEVVFSEPVTNTSDGNIYKDDFSIAINTEPYSLTVNEPTDEDANQLIEDKIPVQTMYFVLNSPFVGSLNPTHNITIGLPSNTKIEDTSGNGALELPDLEIPFQNLVEIIGAVFIDTDIPEDGIADLVEIELATPWDDSSIDVTDFIVGGDKPALFLLQPQGVNDVAIDDNFITLGLTIDGLTLLTLSFESGSAMNTSGYLVGSNASIPTTDNLGPIIYAAATSDNGNGHIDKITVYFNELIDDAASLLVPASFNVEEYVISGVSTGVAVNDQEIELQLTEKTDYDTGIKPNVTVHANTISDGANMVGSDITITETIDNALPRFILPPDDNGGDNSYNASEFFTSKIRASENLFGTEINLNPLGGPNPVFLTSKGGNLTNGYIYEYVSSIGNTLNHGTHDIFFTLKDYNGGEAVSSMNIVIDNILPSISLNKKETTAINPIINGTISTNGDIYESVDDLIIEVSIDGAPYVAATNNGGGSGEWEYQTTLTKGIYDIDVRATDPYGNSATNLDDTDDELQIGGVSFTAAPLVELCMEADSKPLGQIKISESKTNDFKAGSNKTFFINLPAGFAFDTDLVPDLTGSSTLKNVSIVNTSYIGQEALLVTISIDNSSLDLDEIVIDNLAVNAIQGTPLVNQSIKFSNGTADIFSVIGDVEVGYLSSLALPEAPRIFDMNNGGVELEEVAVEVGAGSIALFSKATGTFTYNWYDFDGNLIFTGDSPTLDDLSSGSNNSSTGFDIDNAGLYTLYTSVSNANGCESGTDKINIYVHAEDYYTPATKTFIASNAIGSTIILDNDSDDYDAEFFGVGLKNVDELSNPVTAQFVPTSAGVGNFDVTLRVTNKASGESYDFKTSYTVDPIGSIFSNTVEPSYCELPETIILDVKVNNVPDGFHFYSLRIRKDGAYIDDSNLVPPMGWSNIAPVVSDKPNIGWSFDPETLGVGDYEIIRWIVPSGTTDPIGDANSQEYNKFDVSINELPVTLVSSAYEYTCEDDNPFDLEAKLNGLIDVNVDQYTITDLVNGNGVQVINTSLFDPADPLGIGNGIGTYPVGVYQIDYTSDPLDDPNENGCVSSSIPINITVFSKPLNLKLELGGNDILEGRGELINGIYTFEYCEGETFDALQIALGINQEVRWFTNVSLSNPLEIIGGNADGSLVTAEDLFGYSVSQGGENEDFYYVTVDNLNLGGGCESDPIQIRIIGHSQPSAPHIDLDLSEAGGQNGNDRFEFNYCTTSDATIENIELNALPVDGESYFILLDNADKVLASNITSSSIDLTPHTTSLTPGASYEFKIQQVNKDNSFLEILPTEGREFVGCSSPLTTVAINVFDFADTPTQPDFSGNPNEIEGAIHYYMCADDEFPDISINPGDGVNEYVYEWFEDDGEVNTISIKDNQGDRITADDLADETFAFDVGKVGTYSMFVKLKANVREDASFDGCSSGLVPVALTVFPNSEIPEIVAATSNSDADITDGFTYSFNYCVEAETGLTEDTPFEAVVEYLGENGSNIAWFEANANGTTITNSNPLAFGKDVTAIDLGIAGSQNDVFEFAVIHNTDIVEGYENFDGCFSEPIFFQVNVSTTPATSFAFDGITIGEEMTVSFFDVNQSQIGQSGLDFKIYDNVNNLVQSHTSSSLAPYAFTLPNAGLYTGILTITSTAGCELTEERTFRVLEKIKVEGFYSEDFEDNNGGWFAEFLSTDGLEGDFDQTARESSWEWGKPTNDVNASINLMSGANGSASAWVTGLSGTYSGGENSFVYSPAFDLTSLSNPAIRFMTFRNIDGNKDGVVLQYSTDNGLTWTVIGDYNPEKEVPSTGENWYTENAISSSPGDISVGHKKGEFSDSGYNPKKVGWAGSSQEPEWVESIHALTISESDGAANVRFRFALSASGAPTDFKEGLGFAFDDMQLYNLGKVVLVEQFSSSISDVSNQVEREIIDIIDRDQVMWINYFTDFANDQITKDVLNKRNVVDPGARALYYGVSDIPNSVIDGDVYNQSDELNWDGDDINLKSLQPVEFTMPLSTSGVMHNTTDPGVVSVTASFVSQIEKLNADLSFSFAIVEKEVLIEASNGIDKDTLRNVLRVLLPNATGFNYVGKVAQGDEFKYNVDWIVDNVFDPGKLRVIAFVQDNNRRKVLQSGYADINGASETITGLTKREEISIYPNPSDELLIVKLGKEIAANTDWVLFDQSGKEVKRGTIARGLQEFSINTTDIPTGMYLINILNTDNFRKVGRVIIQH